MAIQESQESTRVLTKDQKLEKEKELLLLNLANSNLTTMQVKVAWLLNHVPATRDSDVTLQIEYWRRFEGHASSSVALDALYKLTRLTSLARARAVIQNVHQLFQGSEKTRARRGALEVEAREIAREAVENAYKSITVFVDESGKTSERLVVGGMWLLDGIGSRDVAEAMKAWRASTGSQDEIHFVNISSGNLHRYLSVLQVLKSNAAAISFKAIMLPRKGVSDVAAALDDMTYHLILRGVDHEHRSGRAALPRHFQLWKDKENEGSDRLRLANLRDRLTQTAKTIYDRKLIINDFFSIDSKSNDFLQFSDLFVASVNRVLSSPDGSHPKDQFARTFLESFGVSRGSSQENPEMIVFEDL